MEEKEKRKQIAKISVFITSIFVIFISISYAFITQTLTGTKKQVINAGVLDLVLEEDNEITISDALPMYDEVGMIQEKNYVFRLINNTANDTNYILKLNKVSTSDLSETIVKYGLVKDGESKIALLSTLIDGVIDKGTIAGSAIQNYELRLWIDSSVTDNSQISGKTLSYTLSVEVSQELEEEITLAAGLYEENDVLVASWDELVNTYGMDVEKGYLLSTYKTDTASPYYVLTNNTELSSGVKLIIPEGVTSIGSYAFFDCKGLTSVTISNSVTRIENSAFGICYGLSQITIPDSVTFIGTYAFWYCKGLTSIAIPDSVTSIGTYAFEYCTGLTSVTIPNSVTSIGSYAFSYCTGLTSITIPSSVTSIGGYAFNECEALTSVTISEGVTSIGNNAFRNCTGLTSVTIPSSVTSIGGYAFSECKALTSVTISEGVTSIGNNAFEYCTGLTSVTIPSSVTSIGGYAFSECEALTSVYLEHTTAPTFVYYCFGKSSGDVCTFYFRNSTVADALIADMHYDSAYGTKSTDYSW